MLNKAKNANHLGLAFFDLLLPNGKMSTNFLMVKTSLLIHTGSAAETFLDSATIGIERQNLCINYNMVKENYRNRRIGDFLKKLILTEGRGTGFPKIYNANNKNGSPEPEFITDADRNYFLVVLRKHPEAQVEAQVELDINEKDF